MHFLTNSLSDPSFEAYMRETHRHMDYRDVKNHLLPKLINSFKEFSCMHHIRFNCSNRFEGRYPAICIQSPLGFVPDVISIEFPHRHESFIVRSDEKETMIQGLENLEIHLRVMLTTGLAHWKPI